MKIVINFWIFFYLQVSHYDAVYIFFKVLNIFDEAVQNMSKL